MKTGQTPKSVTKHLLSQKVISKTVNTFIPLEDKPVNQ